jgi:hypothetical protein
MFSKNFLLFYSVENYERILPHGILKDGCLVAPYMYVLYLLDFC